MSWGRSNVSLQEDHHSIIFRRFLTQTRPDVSSPEVYRPGPPTQISSLLATQQSIVNSQIPTSTLASQRHPLRTLSLSQSAEFDSPERVPFRRLVKRTGSRTPPPSSKRTIGGYQSSPSPSPTVRSNKPLNAFEALARGGKAKQKQKAPTRLEKSEFVEGEAQESDEEVRFGFGFGKEEDEEDGEDLDRTLETLVDDQEMDEETLAAERVMEKFKYVLVPHLASDSGRGIETPL